MKKAWNEANGKGDDHPELKWYEYAAGGVIRGAKNPAAGEKSRPDRSGRQREPDNTEERTPRWPAARQSAPDVNGHKPATRRVEFEGVKDRDSTFSHYLLRDA